MCQGKGLGRWWPFPRITNQTFRDGVPHETKAYANAKSAHHPYFFKQIQ
jgi:hypothetical protein